MAKITREKHLPTGWTIEYDDDRSSFRECPVAFSLLKDGFYIASGVNGDEYHGHYRNYDWMIKSYSIPDAKPIVDKIMDEYRYSIKLENSIKSAEYVLACDKKKKEANDKIEKDAREVLGLPINAVVVEPDVQAAENRRSIISKLFTWSAS